MTLDEALEESRVRQVLRRLDGLKEEYFRRHDVGPFGTIPKVGATRPYYDEPELPTIGQGTFYTLYRRSILALPPTSKTAGVFIIIDNDLSGGNIVKDLPAEDSWQVIGKQDWEPV